MIKSIATAEASFSFEEKNQTKNISSYLQPFSKIVWRAQFN
jgi:hypothetical protein